MAKHILTGKNKLNKLNCEYLLLALILIFALFLRLYALSHSPLWIDEAISSSASKMILEKGFPIFDSGLVYSRAYAFHYIEAFFLLFGQNEFMARFPSVIFGMLTIILAYFIGKEYSKTGGIVSALFFSVFYLEVFFSRQARFYQFFQLMFFLSIYLLYKSGKDKKHQISYLILALAAFFTALDTQIAALVLAPFFILHILIYNKPKYFAIIPAVPLIQKFISIFGLSSGSKESVINYFGSYYSFAGNIHYLLIFFIPGIIWGSLKKWKLTALIILPSIILLIGVFFLETFALRYIYFIVFPILLFFSLLLSFLYEKFGRLIIISILILLIFPSNLVFPHTYVNIIKPVNYNHAFNDYSAPATNYKAVPRDILNEMKREDNTLISFFSSDVEWYIRKPDYVIPFSMDGRGSDDVSYNKTVNGEIKIVDAYSGALILTEETELQRPYYITQDSFSYSKLKPFQIEAFKRLTENCTIVYIAGDLRIWECL